MPKKWSDIETEILTLKQLNKNIFIKNYFTEFKLQYKISKIQVQKQYYLSIVNPKLLQVSLVVNNSFYQ